MEIKNNKIHFIGIGGFGMSGLAEYCIRTGLEVSGSDMTRSAITERLAHLGAKIFYKHVSGNISEDTGLVVYTSAVHDDNPEFKKAKDLNIKLVKRSELLGEIVNDKFLIAVGGTHGKTSTCAMIGKVLTDAGLDPLIFVGGNVPFLDKSTFRMGRGNYAVVEADEYDRSFLTLKPDVIVITNIDEDHLDIYEGLEDIRDTFIKFCNQAKENSLIIYHGEDKNIQKVITEVKNRHVSYGFGSDNDYQIYEFDIGKSIKFNIKSNNNDYKDINLKLQGKHNILNAASVLIVSENLKIDMKKFKKSISEFETVDRRLQLKYDKNNIMVFDDYAHHPVELQSSINALKEMKSGRWLIVVFQPHLYSRTQDFYREFALRLSEADEIVLLDIYPAREKPITGVTSSLIFNEIRKTRNNCVYLNEKQKVITYLISNIKPDDVVLFAGAGDITELCDKFIYQLRDSLN